MEIRQMSGRIRQMIRQMSYLNNNELILNYDELWENKKLSIH